MGNDVARCSTHDIDRALLDVVRLTGAHVGAVYECVPQEHVIRMTVVTGVSRRIAQPWSRVAMSAPVPVAEAARERRLIWLSGHSEVARRYPRTALAFPYHSSMCVAPLLAGSTCWGVVLLLWPGNRAPRLTCRETDAITSAADRMGEVLQEARIPDEPVRDPSPLRTLAHARPAARRTEAEAHAGADLVERLHEGLFAMDLDGRVTYLNEQAAVLLGGERPATTGARLWEALPWLDDPAYENLYLSALFSRLPTSFTALKPPDTWLSFRLFPDLTGVSARVAPASAPDAGPPRAPDPPMGAQSGAGSLFHLMHLSSALTQAVGVKDVTGCVTDQIMPVINAHGLALVSADDERLRILSSLGFPEALTERLDGLPLTVNSAGARAIRSGIPSFFADDDELVRAYPHLKDLYSDLGPVCYLPLLASGRTVGCCVLRFPRPHPFPHEERAALTSLAGMIAQALERARLYDTQSQIARGLQAVLLPRTLPDIPGLGVTARYLPATSGMDIGGDFYDLIRLDHHRVAAVIGDVQGHNVNAAALMGQLRTAIQAHATSGAPPEEVLKRTNRLIHGLDPGLFASCLYAELDLRDGTARAAVAGHPPLILAPPGRTAGVLDTTPGVPLGIEAESAYEATVFRTPPGSLLTLYTDGLVERPGTDLGAAIDDLAGQIEGLRSRPLDVVADELIDQAWRNGQGRDDIALLLIRPHAP
ncbi:PP2C family protein-serine/threonine phosphatase [Streptomyces liangshanensis]|uniref:protein-serine/threonine phosphatase n=1 Tax=Streptomyces liangshanensis TaxID=2717324 RepID=A0A6G9H6X3_9ACTN|nr:SpoIIE family protein phosphatase [Streptomyces liangshanensis]QIQ06056.1 SpoIIE family protein phosphatase [Streptomyces liangshanensis]